jgi:hypothetical protein
MSVYKSNNIFLAIISLIFIVSQISQYDNNCALGTETNIEQGLGTDIVHPASIKYSISFSKNTSNTSDVIHPASINPTNTNLLSYHIIIYTLLVLCILFLLWKFWIIYLKE